MWLFEIELKGLAKVVECRGLSLTLTGYVDLEALRNVPITFSNDAG